LTPLDDELTERAAKPRGYRTSWADGATILPWICWSYPLASNLSRLCGHECLSVLPCRNTDTAISSQLLPPFSVLQMQWSGHIGAKDWASLISAERS
jgi:hypothetical protein